ncbi:PDGLE domain-containing protein [Candidatus Aciduliprofundum boonei]|uniref:PDGLE domain-containing protein n=1 Tax=Aciduliprofundum boonei (strain DSM 19572 / T469) TaxID=439481 RepID=B5ID56_ACIB4|nr:PDGLE domain-containing protein [Candidatus Aciduliprofundum boonei]ADD09177.1 conserved hypothetical protein [Aciduliprofundum boonei T469]EDY35841.1 hypothetical protein ABOONEI_1040 [Aciduliprofundum boonei T469]HII55859.1 hypothetical protein [Candidatus Aciduliprofundum boonei]
MLEAWIKKVLVILLIFCLLSPLGILLTWNKSAWGEWDQVKIGNETWVPQHYSGGAPLDDYDVPGWDSKLMASFGYIISAFVGVFMVIIVTLGIIKLGELSNEFRKRHS